MRLCIFLFVFLSATLLPALSYASENCRDSADFSGFHGIAADKTTLWKVGDIPVCWENGEAFSDKKQLVEDTVNETWGKNTGLSFTGWGSCQSDSKGLRVFVGNIHPRVEDFGCKLDGVENGVKLNFEFKMNGFKSCTASKKKMEECITRISIHEFGHAIGLHHEQNRTDRPEDDVCANERYQGDIPNELLVGRFDKLSIMNYCSPSIWDDYSLPILSDKDITNISKIYPPAEALTISSTSLNGCKNSKLMKFERETDTVKISEVCQGLNGFQVFIEGQDEDSLKLKISKDGKDLIHDDAKDQVINFHNDTLKLAGELTGSKVDWAYRGSSFLGIILKRKRIDQTKTYEAFSYNSEEGIFCHEGSGPTSNQVKTKLSSTSCSNE